MQNQISNLSAQPSVSSAPSIKLWTPGFIAGVTLFLGFPAGVVLAAINWMRMKMNDKAVTHLVAGAIGAIVFLVILILSPGTVGRLLALVVNLGILFYLRRQMESDMEIFQATNRVEKAGWSGGCLISLGILALYLLFGVFLVFVFVFLGVPIPD